MKYFWINVDSSIKRKEIMEKQFKNLNIQNIRISAVTPSDFDNVLEHKEPYFCGNPECLSEKKLNCKYEYACLSSHIKVMQEILKCKDNDEYFIVMEDDIFIPFKIDYDNLIKDIPKDTEILQMLILYSNTLDILYNNCYKNNVRFIKYQPILPSTGMYMVSKKGAKKLVDLYVNKNNKYDFSKFNNIKVADILLYTSVNTYCTTIPYCYPLMKLGSEIHPEHLDVHDKAVITIKNILNECKNKNYVIEDYINQEYVLSDLIL
jgi:GR25 family glycosyltransferase involved in LPS biosynthesis